MMQSSSTAASFQDCAISVASPALNARYCETPEIIADASPGCFDDDGPTGFTSALLEQHDPSASWARLWQPGRSRAVLSSYPSSPSSFLNVLINAQQNFGTRSQFGVLVESEEE
jgi:hypothetical protein